MIVIKQYIWQELFVVLKFVLDNSLSLRKLCGSLLSCSLWLCITPSCCSKTTKVLRNYNYCFCIYFLESLTKKLNIILVNLVLHLETCLITLSQLYIYIKCKII